MLELGRLRHPSLSDIHWEKPPPLVPRRLRLELDERIDRRGRVQRAPDDADLARIAAALREADVESVAIALLNSYLEPAHERIAAERLRAHLPDVGLSVSSALAPEAKEYERTSTAVVNAYVQPLVDRYVARLEREVARMGVRAPLRIMQSYCRRASRGPSGAATPSSTRARAAAGTGIRGSAIRRSYCATSWTAGSRWTPRGATMASSSTATAWTSRRRHACGAAGRRTPISCARRPSGRWRAARRGPMLRG